MKNIARKQFSDSDPFQLKSKKFSDDKSEETHLGGEKIRREIYEPQGSNITDIKRGLELRLITEATRVGDSSKAEFTVNSKSSKIKTAKPLRTNILNKLKFHAIGSLGAMVLSVATLWLAIMLNQINLSLSGNFVAEPLVSLILIRSLYFQMTGTKAILSDYGIRKNVKMILVDEGKINIVFLAVCFMLSWPLTGLSVLIFALLNVCIQLCLMAVARLVIKMHARQDVTSGNMVREAVIIGTGPRAKKIADMILGSPELETGVKGFLDFQREGLWRYRDIPLLGHPEILEELIATSQLDALFLAVEEEDVTLSHSLMEMIEKMGVTIFEMPNIYDPKLARVRPTYVGDMPTIVYRSDPESKLPVKLKGFIDRVGAFLGLVMTSPIMLVVAILVKMTSRGPVFFKQVRTGLNGRPFELYKFRTMTSDAENLKRDLMTQNEMSGPVFKIKKDPRVTKVGRLLRKYSIDELPQFMNIIRGDMSLVGPRPPLPQEVSRFEPWQHRKLSVKPGLTCLWQVNGRNDIDFEDWMLLDLQYIDNWSLWLDTKIMVKTIPAVMKGSGR